VKLAKFWITLATSVSFLEVFSSGYSAVNLTQCQFVSDITEFKREFNSNSMVFKSDIMEFKSEFKSDIM